MISVYVDMSNLNLDKKIEHICHEEKSKLAVHNRLAEMCDPYVPMDSGTLAQTTRITSDGVTYSSPYAHYQYEGQVYGPNIPIIQDGIVVGWFSPPRKKKHPTGAEINYSKEVHPLATSHWDKAMLRDNKDKFEAEIKRILTERYNELYGK